MGCATSKQLETVLKAEGLETVSRKRNSRFTTRRSQSHRQSRSKNQRQFHHHVSLKSSTYGVLGSEALPEQKPVSPQKSHSFDSASQVIEKLKKLELSNESGPQPWSEVSKVLENLKPELENGASLKKDELGLGEWDSGGLKVHTVEEIDARIGKAGEDKQNHSPDEARTTTIVDPELLNSLQNHLKHFSGEQLDLLESEKEKEKEEIQRPAKRNPLEDFEEKCPPGGENSVVLYTTSLRGIRKTFEDCNTVRSILEGFGVSVDERDVSMHSDFRNEIRDLMGKPVPAPSLFIRGRYIGGAEEVMNLNDDGKLSDLLEGFCSGNAGAGKPCEGCGGIRFVPCLECSGSRKLHDSENSVLRCPHCNENGLIQCPLCCS
eukprot:TRINITY_DN3476_c0_g1_i1.p1 TRINITY_DN3476_c0_g1~~TRINITY_DN3476_c0_g1_i1.p1  ORF type:complete len:377 (+),score=60.46 TRINITY_DN3476_c0_g1_i1:258-1388(+)